MPGEETWVGAALTGLGIAGAWFATWLSRRGKRADEKIEQGRQSFDELRELATVRGTEIERLRAERDAADAEKERLRDSWESRWDRQMQRCRVVTDTATATIVALQQRDLSSEEVDSRANALIQSVEEHNLSDHDVTYGSPEEV